LDEDDDNKQAVDGEDNEDNEVADDFDLESFGKKKKKKKVKTTDDDGQEQDNAGAAEGNKTFY
jgi:hypothetical protein